MDFSTVIPVLCNGQPVDFVQEATTSSTLSPASDSSDDFEMPTDVLDAAETLQRCEPLTAFVDKGPGVTTDPTIDEEIHRETFSSLVKDELRQKITEKRRSRGLPEFLTEYRPTVKEELTEEEKEKRRIRRERNRKAATKCRQKKREMAQKIKTDAGEQERRNSELKQEIEILQRQRQVLTNILMHHQESDTTCYLRPKFNQNTLPSPIAAGSSMQRWSRPST
ncbi:uncharacterized protein LOC102809373 [Saccoglossus kowalevskii]